LSPDLRGKDVRVIAYVRVSTDEQGSSGAGLAAQRDAVLAECECREWSVHAVIEDAGATGKHLRRPGIQRALDLLGSGEEHVLGVAKLDRLSRSLLDFAGLMATAQKQGWAIVSLDCMVDTTRPAGEAMASVLLTFAQYERRLIGQRTRDALAVKRAQGVRLGRPPVLPADIRRRIRWERARGRTLQEIADRLNRDGLPTAHGGSQWWTSTVSAVLRSEGHGKAVKSPA
jgi:DNA invertase Pin-like site-specific DNA recombinase